MRLALLATALTFPAAVPAAAQMVPGPQPPVTPPPTEYPPVRLGCGELVDDSVECSGAIPSGINYQELGDIRMTLDPTARVEGGLRIGGTRLVIGPGGGRFEFSATGVATVAMEEGSSVTNAGGPGIFVASQQGVDILSTDVAAVGQWGIRAFSHGPVTIRSTGRLALQTSEGYSGISAQSAFGNVTIENVGDISVAGNAAGILAIAGTGSESATGAIDVVNQGSIRMEGSSSTGIVGLVSNSGTVNLTNEGIIESGLYGLLASSARDRSHAENQGSITTAGESGHGIWSRSLNALSSAINGQTGRIATRGDNALGILLTHEVNLGASSPPLLAGLNQGTITTRGQQADGMVAATEVGAVVLVNEGSIATTGDRSNGISIYRAAPQAALVIANWGSVTTSGSSAMGMFVRADGTSTSIAAPGTISTAGSGSHGIDFADSGSGTLHLDAGSIATTGEASDAIRLEGAGGAFDLALHGVIRSSRGFGIRADAGSGEAFVRVASTADVDGAAGAIRMTAGPARLAIDGRVGSSGHRAIEIDGGPSDVRIGSSGNVRGALFFGSASDVVRNAGVVQLEGVSDFGGGNDMFANLGQVRTGTGSTAIAGLEQFDNQGVVSLADGNPADVLDLGSARWIGSGSSTLVLDIGGDRGELLSDRLRLAEVTGTTMVVLSRAYGSIPLGHSVQLVEASSPIPEDAFRLDGGLTGPGFLAFRLTTEGNSLSVSAVPGIAARLAADVPQRLASDWREATDEWLRQSLVAPAPAGPGQPLSFWFRPAVRDAGSLPSGRAVNLVSGGDPGEGRVLHRRRGLQSGIEHRSGRWIGGLTMGVLSGHSSLGGVGETLDSRSRNLGAYVGWRGPRGWYAGALGTIEKVGVGLRLVRGSFDAHAHGSVGGLAVEGGTQVRLGPLTLLPHARLAWSTFSVGPMHDGAVTLRYGRRQEASARLGLSITPPSLELGRLYLAPRLELTAERVFADPARMELEIDNSRSLLSASEGRTLGAARLSFQGRLGDDIKIEVGSAIRTEASHGIRADGGLRLLF